MSGKTIGEQIADLKATRADVQKRMEAVVQKSIDEARSMNDAETAEFDSHEAQIRTLDGDIERFSRLEAMQAKTAKPVEDVAEGSLVLPGGLPVGGTPTSPAPVSNPAGN